MLRDFYTLLRQVRSGILLGLLLLAAGCAHPSSNAVTQFSTIDAILAGAYDGHVTCKELARHGDFGIGTFDKLDGEMVLLDGKVHQVKADGKVYTPSPNLTVPFASVVNFSPDRKIELASGTDFPQLQTILDHAIANTNILYAFKVKGHFQTVKTRSVPVQKKPYPPLTTVTQNQPTFEMQNVTGTLVGFRLPVYLKGINVPGYHVHFLSSDNRSGGHLLQFKLAEGAVEIAPSRQLQLILPKDDEGFSQIDLSRDRGHDLEKAEK